MRAARACEVRELGIRKRSGANFSAGGTLCGFRICKIVLRITPISSGFGRLTRREKTTAPDSGESEKGNFDLPELG